MLWKSALVTDLSGSLGGFTASKNKGGRYFRAKVDPTNPDTSRQQAVRIDFSAAATSWSETLTQTQRDAWDLYGTNVTVTNRLGDQINISGFNHYVRSFTALLAAGLPTVDDGPTIFSLPAVDVGFDASISEASQIISVSFTDSEPWVSEDNAGMLVSMSIPQGEGRTFLSPQKRISDTILGNLALPLTSPQDISVPFAVAENQKVIVSARILRADGRVSEVFRTTVVIAA